MELLKALTGLILPPRCGLCGEFLAPDGSGEALCPDCLARLAPDGEPVCSVCGGILEGEGPEICPDCRADPPAFERAAPAALFAGPLAQAIRNFKYRGRTELAPVLGLILDGVNWPPGFPATFDLILPVPLHPSRLRARGFNQAALAGRHLSHRGLLSNDLLIRSRRTRPQVELDGPARRTNVRDAFSLSRPEEVRGKTILLVDDVITTGATCRECAAILKRAGAARVLVRSLARSVGF